MTVAVLPLFPKPLACTVLWTPSPPDNIQSNNWKISHGNITVQFPQLICYPFFSPPSAYVSMLEMKKRTKETKQFFECIKGTQKIWISLNIVQTVFGYKGISLAFICYFDLKTKERHAFMEVSAWSWYIIHIKIKMCRRLNTLFINKPHMWPSPFIFFPNP